MKRGNGDVVVLRALGLGDLLTAVPALRGIARAFPGRTITVLTPETLDPLVRAAVPDAVVCAADGLGDVHGPLHPEVAINLHGRGPASTMALSHLRPTTLVAYGVPALSGTCLTWRSDEHEIDRWCRLVRDTWQVPVSRNDLLLPVTRPSNAMRSRRPVVIIHAGAASAARRWFPQRFAAVASALVDDGCRVVLTGTALERPRCERLAAWSGQRVDTSRVGAMGLEDLCRAIASAQLLVSGDTGVAHLAEAYRTPSVTLFGPISPSLWGPLDRKRHVALWSGDACGSPRPGDPAGDHIDPRLADITVASVLEPSRALLAEFGREAPRVPVLHAEPQR